MSLLETKDPNDRLRQGINLRAEADDAWTKSLEQPRANGKASGLVSMCAADITPEKVSWVWDQRLPLGKCVLVAGEGGLGKSMVLAWIAATVSRGREWPCVEGRSPLGSIIILSAEDDAADTIVPRLIAADADCSKIHIISAVHEQDDKGRRSFNLQLDIPKLERKITEVDDVLLIIIDPITSYLGKVDSHKNAELRSVLEPLGEMAARLDVTIIANTHLSKAAGGSANNRVIGSVAFVNHARAAFIVTADAEDNGRRLFLPSKTNLGRPREGLAYRIADTTISVGDGELIFAPYVKWEASTVTMSADEAVAAMACNSEGKTAKGEAMEFLRDVLSDGARPAADIMKQARADGHTNKAIRSARETLQVVSNREGFGPGSKCLWSLPKTSFHIDAHQAKREDVGIYGQVFHSQRVAGVRGSIDAHHKKRASMGDQGTYVSIEQDPDAELPQAGTDGWPELPAFLDRRLGQQR